MTRYVVYNADGYTSSKFPRSVDARAFARRLLEEHPAMPSVTIYAETETEFRLFARVFRLDRSPPANQLADDEPIEQDSDAAYNGL